MIFDRLLSPRAGTPAPDDDYWYTDVSTVARSGANVTPDSAMRVVAVLACIRVLAETIASLPWILYRRLPDGRGKERATEHPLYSILHDQPNRWQTSFDFVEMMIGHCALRGNAYAQRIPGPQGSVQELIPLHPDRVTVYRLQDRRLRYEVRDEQTGVARSLNQEEVFHIRWMSSDGMTGMGPIELARESVGLSLATEAHGARVFKNKAVPGAVITHPAVLKGPGRANLKRVIDEQYTGANVHKTLVLEEGMTWAQMGMTNKDAQYLDARKYQVTDIARLFRIPPHMIADLDRATFTNIEHQAIDFVVHTIRPWCVRIERATSRDLIVDTDQYFSEFLLDGLLRGDFKTRMEGYALAIQNRIFTPNEVREMENRNPSEGGDDMLVPLNMQREGEATPVEEEAVEVPAAEATLGTSDVSSKVFDPWIADIAERLSNAELRELGKRANKAEEDRERFNRWVIDFYEVHRVYVNRTLAPLGKAWTTQTGETLTFDGVLAELIDDPCEQLQTVEDVPGLVEKWRAERASGIITALAERLNNERASV